MTSALLVACRSPQSSPPSEQTSPGAATAPSPGSSAAPGQAAPPATGPSDGSGLGATAAPSAAQSGSGALAGARAYAFDGDPVDAAPPAFTFGRTGSGAAGRWVVLADPGAPSKPNVLAQTDADSTDFRFPVAVANEPRLRDLRLSVRCKMISGKVDQACGMVFRYQNENNYYITRANALEGNIRLYFVKDGRRQQSATYRGEVTANAWHDYRVEARGDHIQVYWDGAKVLEHDDATFKGDGKAGVWTKADSVTHFDDLTIEPL